MLTATLMEKMAEVAPEAHDFILGTADEVRESPFRDEITLELDGIVKKAGFGSTLGKGALAATGAIAAGVAYSLAGDMYDSLRRGITKTHHYKKMLAENPDLRERPAKDVQKVFSTLHRFNPEFSADPMVSGSFVRNNLALAGSDQGTVDMHTLINLVSARKNLSDIRKLPIPGKVPWPTDLEDQKTLSEIEKNWGSARLPVLDQNKVNTGGQAKPRP